MAERQEFDKRTRQLLAYRAAFICSIGGEITIGPTAGLEGSVSIGEAAHIHAASPGGPRFTPDQTDLERRSISNGIWVCSTCHKLIDTDVDRFPSDKLRQRKAAAEKDAFEKMNLHLLAREQIDLRAGDLLLLPAPPRDWDDLVELSRRDVQRLKSSYRWTGDVVPARLRFSVHDETVETTPETCVNLLGPYQSVIVSGDGGSGKTTAMLQMAEALVGTGRIIPLFASIPDWLFSRKDFFEYVQLRQSLTSVPRAMLLQLAEEGRTAFLLDGWNEVGSSEREASSRLVDGLRRNFPNAIIVLTTRPNARSFEDDTMSAEILKLDWHDVRRLVYKRRGRQGLRALRRLSNLGLEELARTPFYLNALADGPLGDNLPRTRAEILDQIVPEFERANPRALRLHSVFFETQRTFLMAFACRLRDRVDSTIAVADAHRLLRDVSHELSEQGQLGTLANPAPALEMLVDVQLLSQEPTGSIRFQHELFADWYAYRKLIEAKPFFPDEPFARTAFLSHFVDNAAWEEAILFASETLSLSGEEGRQAVGRLALAGLEVSPLLAARIIHRSHDTVWSSVKLAVVDWLNRWLAAHYPEGVGFNPPSRPLRFMLAARKPDLDELAKPHLDASRACREFLAQAGRLDLLPPPRIRAIFNGPFLIGVIREGSPESALAKRQEPATAIQILSEPRSVLGLDFESACKLGSKFWWLPDIDQTPGLHDWNACSIAGSENEPDWKSEIATYFSDASVLSKLVARVLRIEHRADRLNRFRRSNKYDQRADAIRRIVRRMACCHPDELVILLETHSSATDLQRISVLCDVIAGHRQSGHRNRSSKVAVLGLSTDRRGRLAEIIAAWIERAIADPAFEYRHACCLADAAARLQDPQLAAPLERLLRHCLVYFPQSLEAGTASRWHWADTPSLGPAPAPILEAVLANDDGRVQSLLAELSSRDEIVVDCAYALARFAYPGFDYDIRLSEMPSRRETEDRPAIPLIDSHSASQFASAIARLLDRGDTIAAGRAGRCLASIPGILNPRQIERLLFSIDLRPRIGLLKALAWAGLTFDGAAAAVWVKDYVKQSRYETSIMDTVCVLMFSDRPLESAGYYQRPSPGAWWHREEDVFLRILDKAPADIATEILFALVQVDAGVSGDRGWIERVTSLATRSVARKLVDMSRSPLHQDMVRQLGNDASAKERLAASDTDLFDYIAGTFDPHNVSVPYAEPFLFLQGRLSWKQIAAIATSYADLGLEMDSTLRTLIMTAFGTTDDLSIPDTATLQDARRTLFRYSDVTSGPRVLLDALRLIDDCCEVHGGYDLMPRHPDIASGLPWPVSSNETAAHPTASGSYP